MAFKLEIDYSSRKDVCAADICPLRSIRKFVNPNKTYTSEADAITAFRRIGEEFNLDDFQTSLNKAAMSCHIGNRPLSCGRADSRVKSSFQK